eukprot:Skav217107  [mRNA]  locus=scaffold1627:95054:96231:- [translate_table: standard]
MATVGHGATVAAHPRNGPVQVLSTGDFEGRKRLRSDEQNTSERRSTAPPRSNLAEVLTTSSASCEELSPYIRFGEISVKLIYAAAKQHAQRTAQ